MNLQACCASGSAASLPRAGPCSSIRRIASRLADCGISVLDEEQEVFAAALIYLGRDPHEEGEEAIAAVGALFERHPPASALLPLQPLPRGSGERRALPGDGLLGRRAAGATPGRGEPAGPERSPSCCRRRARCAGWT
ncbi:MAG: hypothetical protein RML12_09700 [Xanthomonadales bacterium]|nr:hypothetical protein [Xanthomonadales bacterium]